jgi:hypothetical protein
MQGADWVSPEVREGGSRKQYYNREKREEEGEKRGRVWGRRGLCSGGRLERKKSRHDEVEIGRHDVVKQQPALAQRGKEACFSHAT